MCGILGSINVPGIHKGLSLIMHRGPDSNGARVLNNRFHHVYLLHSRLAIVDLTEAGHQPMMSYDEMGCITFNGEIYNHEDIKQELKDICFNGHSDTETIVNHFRQFGVFNTLSKLNGIFALAYYDLAEQHLYLARDRYGVKPLYYSFENNTLTFSSEIKPLISESFPGYNEGALMTCVSMRYCPSPLTIYKNVKKVEPGQVLVFNLQSPQVLKCEKYFTEVPGKIGYREGPLNGLVNEYGDLFEKAVQRQLMADVEVGVLLSGGIDSALVAAVAKKKSSLSVKAFTIGFEEEQNEIDEIEKASHTAEVLGLDHYCKKIKFSDFLSSIKKIIGIVEEPIGTTSILPMYELSRLAASKVKVVLSGQGADEPLGGYNKYRGLALLQRLRSYRFIGQLTQHLSPFRSKERFNRMLGAVNAKSTIDAYLAFNEIMSVPEIKELFCADRYDKVVVQYQAQRELIKDILVQRLPKDTPFQNIFPFYDTCTSLSDDLLMYTDKITMHFSMECRVPMLDNDLVEFIESLKTQYKFSATQGKIIHKEFAHQYLPSSIINRRKLGFQSPTTIWFRKYYPQLQSLFQSSKDFCTVFDIRAVHHLIESHRNGKSYEKQIFLLLSIYFLMEDNYERQKIGTTGHPGRQPVHG